MAKIKVDVDVLSDVVRSLKGISQHIENISQGVKDTKKILQKDDLGNAAVHDAFQGNIEVLRKNCNRVSEDIKKHSSQLEQIVMNFRKEVDDNKKTIQELDPGNIGW